MKVFFDTNVLISAFATRGLSADPFRLVVAEHELLTGEVNLTEFRRVLRERFKVPPAEIALVEDQLRAHTIVARPAAPSDPGCAIWTTHQCSPRRWRVGRSSWSAAIRIS